MCQNNFKMTKYGWPNHQSHGCFPLCNLISNVDALLCSIIGIDVVVCYKQMDMEWGSSINRNTCFWRKDKRQIILPLLRTKNMATMMPGIFLLHVVMHKTRTSPQNHVPGRKKEIYSKCLCILGVLISLQGWLKWKKNSRMLHLYIDESIRKIHTLHSNHRIFNSYFVFEFPKHFGVITIIKTPPGSPFTNMD